MSLNFTHKPNYFLYAQLIIHHIDQYLKQHPSTTQAEFNLQDIYQLFKQDLASTTTNLDGIMNIADEYKVETLSGDQKLIQHYHIDPTEHTLTIQFNADAAIAVHEGKKIVAPDATIQE